MIDSIPTWVWQAVGVDPADVVGMDVTTFGDGTGAASDEVQLITADPSGSHAVRLVRKRLRPLRSGPHADDSRRPDHWAYWRRELIAYRAGVLPAGPGLRAPRLYGTADDALFIEYVGELEPTAGAAATALARWHAADRVEDQPWLARHQLAQRLAVTDLDWSIVDSDPRLPGIWDRRHDYLTELDALPRGIAHGDFGVGNLRAHDGGVVALDWATLGVSPVGFDIAHLALATLDESVLPIYLGGLRGRYDAQAVELGYRITVALVGVSRAHWMASRSIPLPRGYLDFVCAQLPAPSDGTDR